MVGGAVVSYSRGSTASLTAEWREYAGGPFVDVDTVQITITAMLDGAVAIGPTATGVTNPATGVNAYAWAIPTDLAEGDYLVSWAGVDPQDDAVVATELVTVLASTAIGDSYASLAKLKARLGIPDSVTTKDAELQDRLDSATVDINRWCGRQFGRDEEASERRFYPGPTGVDVDDFWTADDLAVTPYVGTTAGTAWTVSGLTLEPLSGVVDGVPGWPYRRLSYGWALGATFGFYGASTVAVSARWGWASVPKNVETACLLLAAMDNKAGDAPFGVVGFGDFAMRIRSNPMAEEKLRPYVREAAKVGT
jgi:hypothetical protein